MSDFDWDDNVAPLVYLITIRPGSNRIKISTLLVLLLMGVFPNFAQNTKKVPKFTDYKVNERFNRFPAKAIIRGKRARFYRTRITNGAKLGPNFAGRFTFVGWGAGLGAFDFAVIDARSGKLYFPPFEYIDASFYGEPNLGDGKNPDFRLNSSLIIFYGQKNGESPLGIYYYVFKKGRFRLVKFVRAKTGSELQ